MNTKITPELIEEIRKLQSGTCEDVSQLLNMTKDGISEILDKWIKDQNTKSDVQQKLYEDIYNRINELDDPSRFYSWVQELMAEHLGIRLMPEQEGGSETVQTTGNEQMTNQGKSGKKPWIAALIAVVVLAVLGAGGYYGVQKHQETVRQNNLIEAQTILQESLNLDDAWYKADEEKDWAKLEELYQQMIDLGSSEGYYRMGDVYAAEKSGKQDYEKAYEYYQQAADMGNANAYYAIGMLYAEGHHFEQDNVKTREYLEKAAEMGSAYATGDIGNGYYSAKYGYEKNMEKAVEYWSKTIELCEREDILTTNHFYSSYLRGVGNSYVQGEGVEQNAAYGMELLTKAADLGDQIAANNLGWFYLVNYEDIGIEQNAELGLKYANLAAELGDPYGYSAIAWYYSGAGDEAKSEEYIAKAIESDSENPELFYSLGSNHISWGKYEKAIEYYQKAAELGSKQAVNNQIGVCYYRMGNTEKALEYYLKSIEAGEDNGGVNYNNVGMRYWDMDENEKAIEYLLKASELGAKDVFNAIGENYAEMGDTDRALEYYLKSIEANENMEGANYSNAANLYYNMKESDKAFEYALKAEELESANGTFIVALCYGNGVGVEQDYAKAMEYCLKAQERGYKGSNLAEAIEILKGMGY